MTFVRTDEWLVRLELKFGWPRGMMCGGNCSICCSIFVPLTYMASSMVQRMWYNSIYDCQEYMIQFEYVSLLPEKRINDNHIIRAGTSTQPVVHYTSRSIRTHTPSKSVCVLQCVQCWHTFNEPVLPMCQAVTHCTRARIYDFDVVFVVVAFVWFYVMICAMWLS